MATTTGTVIKPASYDPDVVVHVCRVSGEPIANDVGSLTSQPVGTVFICECGRHWVVRPRNNSIHFPGQWKAVRWHHFAARKQIAAYLTMRRG